MSVAMDRPRRRETPLRLTVTRFLDHRAALLDLIVDAEAGRHVLLFRHLEPVSYTHLTLPTICSV